MAWHGPYASARTNKSLGYHGLLYGAAVLTSGKPEGAHEIAPESCLISRGRLCNRLLHSFHDPALVIRQVYDVYSNRQ